MDMKVGDTSPRTLSINVDLTGATATLLVHPENGAGELVGDEVPLVVSDPAGVVTWTPDGSLAVGSYWLEVRVDRTAVGMGTATAPEVGYLVLDVHATSVAA